MNISETIAKLRKVKNVTQEAVVQAVGVSTQAVSKWENGGLPDVELLPAIADYFGVSIDTLFGREISAGNLKKPSPGDSRRCRKRSEWSLPSSFRG